MHPARKSAVLFLACLLAACSTPATRQSTSGNAAEPAVARPEMPRSKMEDQRAANEVVLQAMGLLDTGYRFGGSNPDAGLDCSGMVSLVVERATGRKLPHNAARIAAQTRPISRDDLRPADLVFFNTNGNPYSHMGIYLGDGRFVHAPSSKGRVRIDQLGASYYAKRFTGARSLFD